MTDIQSLVRSIAAKLAAGQRTLVTAESCTGGLVASYLTGIPGSSDWFEGAFVTYRLSAKVHMLGVRQKSLDEFTAVSEPVAREMAIGALHQSAADLCVAITGIAGPGGGDIVTPVGTVWFAWAAKVHNQYEVLQTSHHLLEGSREDIRIRAATIALEGVLQSI